MPHSIALPKNPIVPHGNKPGESQHVIDGLRTANLALVQTADENAVLQIDKFYLASIVEFSNDAIVSTNLNGIVTSWNGTAETLFGYTRLEMIGRPIALLFPPDCLGEEADSYARLKAGEIIAHHETRRLRADGTEVSVSITASPIRDSTGTIVGVSKILQNITEQMLDREKVKTLQAELVHLSRWNMMGMMASSLAHEINQPLTAILNYVHAARRTLKSAAPEGERAIAFLDQAVAETKLASGIIRSLRSFIEKRETGRKPESINDVLTEGLALSLYLRRDTRSRISQTMAVDLPPVLIDKIQIQQVLLNLVRNAFEAMSEIPAGQVVIETAAGERDFITVSVSDNGPGVSPEILNQLFQPFVTTKEKGMGVGLSICQAIVEAHGGRIWTEPNLPQGVTFRFRLPVVAEDSSHAT